MKLKIGVIFGGESVEHEVSIISALQAIKNIDDTKYEVIPIYISKERYWYTGDFLLDIKNYNDLEILKQKTKKISLYKKDNEYVLKSTDSIFNKTINTIDVAFPIVHGQNVEDGTLAGFLDTIGIPYVGSKVLGSSLGQDKIVLKQVLKSDNIPIVDYVWFYDKEYLLEKEKHLKEIKKLGYPVVVKPASLGSSVGIKFVSDEKTIEEAIEDAISYDKKIIIEKAVQNLIEVNCSVVGSYEMCTASEIEEVTSEDSILTYENKYIGNNKTKGSSKGIVNTKRIIPANIDKKLYDEICETSKKVFRTLNLSGVCRMDYLINKETNEYFVNEPNTIPGSLSFYLWENKGKKYKELLTELITLAIKEYKDKNKKMSHFDTNILKEFNGNGIKK